MAELDPRIKEILAKQGEPQVQDPRIKEILSMQNQTSAMQEEPPQVLNEPADIDWKQRWQVKNFGGTTDDQIRFLQQNNPQLEIKEYEGNIIAKRPEEKAWKKLDPTGFSSIEEFGRDIADVTVDVPASILTGLAATKAGIAGGLSSFGLGAVPAAATAAGLTSGAIEKLRQEVGKRMGTVGEGSAGDIALAAASGALPIGILGSGVSKAAVKQAVSDPAKALKFLRKERLPIFFDTVEGGAKKLSQESIDLAERQLAEKQGGIGKAVKGFAAELVTGAKKTDIDDALSATPAKIVDQLIGNGVGLDPAKKYTNQEIVQIMNNQGQLSGLAESASNTASNAFLNKNLELSGQITELFKGIGKKFDAAKSGQALEEIVAAGESARTEGGKALANQAKSILAKYFRPIQEQADDFIGPFPDRRFREGAREFLVDPKEYQQIAAQIKDLADIAATQRTVEGMDAISKQLRPTLLKISKNMTDDIWNATDEIKDSGLRKQWAKYKQDYREIAKHFETDEKTLKTITNINNPANKILKEKIAKFDKDYDSNILDFAKIASTAKIFGDDSMLQASRNGVTSTSRILNAQELARSMGYITGLGTGVAGAAQALGQVGSGSAGMLTSPRAVKKYMDIAGGAKETVGNIAEQLSRRTPQTAKDALENVRKLREQYSALSTPQLGVTAWQLMGGK